MGKALEQFKESLELAKSLKKLERDNYSNSPRVNEQPFVKGLRGGAAVLMVASFEFFLKRLFEEYLSVLNTVPKSIDFDKLPDNLKVTVVFNSLNNAMKGPQFSSKPPKVDRINDIIAVCKMLINEQISPESFTETGSNPNSDSVNNLFKQVGILNIFDKIKPIFESKWRSPVSHDFIKSKLDEIVRTRHVVAHTADTLNISRHTQNESLRYLSILAELLEKELKEHIKTIKINAKI